MNMHKSEDRESGAVAIAEELYHGRLPDPHRDARRITR
jgi:hypothetical protein